MPDGPFQLQDTAKNQLSRDGLVATKLCTHVKDAESINQRCVLAALRIDLLWRWLALTALPPILTRILL